jgi:hypothetical protein
VSTPPVKPRDVGRWLGAAYAARMQRVARTMEDLHDGDVAILVTDQQLEHEQLFRSGEINRVRDHFNAKTFMNWMWSPTSWGVQRSMGTSFSGAGTPRPGSA